MRTKPFAVKLAALGAVAVLLSFAAPTLAAAPEDQEIRYAEFIQPWDASIPERAVADEAIWSFEALGKIFDIHLTSNEQLIAKLPDADRREILAESVILRGALLDNPDSWVRLSETQHGISGMIWDGQDHIVIEPALRVENQLDLAAPLAADDDRLAIYRYADQTHDGITCAADTHGHEGLSLGGDVSVSGGGVQAGIGTLDVVLVLDQFWGGDHVGIFNVVDGIYSGQVGVNINIFSTETANLFPPRGQDLLDEFDDYVGNRSNIGIAHLMSGRGDTGWAGIAYVAQLCNSFAHGVSVDFGFSDTITIVAHEIGHNGSALHDQDVGCPRFLIMDAFVSGSQTFSSCSINNLVPFMSAASCIDGDPPGGDGFCFKFSDFCDGLEITKDGNDLSGLWVDTDCAGADVAMRGRFGGSFSNNCSGGNSRAIFACRSADGCDVGGSQWWFNIYNTSDPIDMNNGDYPVGTCWIDELAVTVTPGSCPSAVAGGQASTAISPDF